MNVKPSRAVEHGRGRGGGDKPSCLDATLAFDWIEADEVQGNVLEDGEVVSSMAGAGTHLIVGEDPVRVKIVVASVMQPTVEYRYRPNAFL
jgi:hypothetical protein